MKMQKVNSFFMSSDFELKIIAKEKGLSRIINCFREWRIRIEFQFRCPSNEQWSLMFFARKELSKYFQLETQLSSNMCFSHCNFYEIMKLFMSIISISTNCFGLTNVSLYTLSHFQPHRNAYKAEIATTLLVIVLFFA